MGQYDPRENPVDQTHVCSGTHPQCEVKTFDKGKGRQAFQVAQWVKKPANAER